MDRLVRVLPEFVPLFSSAHFFASLVILKQKAVHVLLLDNIDSFTWNIFHYLEALDTSVDVKDHHTIDVDTIREYDAVVLSPGPGIPSEAGKLMEVIDEAVRNDVPVLGICLGMQAIAEYFGGTIYNQQQVKHGQQAVIMHAVSVLFKDLPESFRVGLYHSWAVSPELPEALRATAFSEDNVMMALEHVTRPVFGVQFHPESILSDYGKELLNNFLSQV